MEKPGFRAGYVSVIGRPNVGKSTQINHLMRQKIAAVSPLPQTTRRRQLGILTLENAQIVFVDTPGLHIPHHKLGDFMNEEAELSLMDADVILWLLDASELPTEEDHLIAKRLGNLRRCPPTLLGVNKIDRLSPSDLPEREKAMHALFPQAKAFSISASTGNGVEPLLQALLAHLPEGHPFFDEDQVTDFYERDIAADLIREACMLYLKKEVPHCVAIRIDSYTERGEDGALIAATIFVERDSQKGIVIGRGGEMLKQIGMTARKEIEAMSGRKVYLELRVKVNSNWRNNPDALRLLGFVETRER